LEEQSFKSLADNLDCICYFIRPDHTLIWKNKKADDFLRNSSAQKCFNIFYDRETPCEDCNISIAKKRGDAPFITREINGYFYHHKIIPVYEQNLYIGSFIILKDITAQIQTEKREYISNLRFNTICEIGNLGVWEFNPKEKNILYLNPVWYTSLGYEPYEYPPTTETFANLIHKNDLDRVFKEIDNMSLKKQINFQIQFRLKRKDGTYQSIKSYGKAVEFDQNGFPVKMTGIHMDIKEFNDD